MCAETAPRAARNSASASQTRSSASQTTQRGSQSIFAGTVPRRERHPGSHPCESRITSQFWAHQCSANHALNSESHYTYILHAPLGHLWLCSVTRFVSKPDCGIRRATAYLRPRHGRSLRRFLHRNKNLTSLLHASKSTATSRAVLSVAHHASVSK
jgi:hypothetical protein